MMRGMPSRRTKHAWLRLPTPATQVRECGLRGSRGEASSASAPRRTARASITGVLRVTAAMLLIVGLWRSGAYLWWTASGQPTGARLLFNAAAVNDIEGVRRALDGGVLADA